jgi:adenine-specific DNA-methyltransferase
MVIPAARLKFYRRVSTLAALASSADDSAERLVRSLLYLWQRRSFGHLLPARAPWRTSDYLQDGAVLDFANWLAEQPFNEAAYWLATAYAVWVGEETRTKRALFFTPPALADRVIANLVKQGASLTNHHWHDPACGGAAFLVPIAQGMAVALAKAGLTPSEQLARIARNLSGNDLDPVLLDLSRSFLEMALSAVVRAAGIRPAFRLFRGDGLVSEEIEALKPDVVACNPPYRKLKADEVKRYRKRHGEVIEGQPNIYGLFINRTLQLPRPRGLVGLLTPTSYLSGPSFAKLRTKLLSSSAVLHVDMLSDRTSMFINVEQETAVTILRVRDVQKAQASKTQVNVLEPDGQFRDVGDYLLPNSGRPWPIPRAVEDANLLRLAEEHDFRLEDYGYVAGVGHLVAYRDERRRFAQLPTVKTIGRVKRRTPRRLIVPLVWATDITPGGKFEHGRKSKFHRAEQFVQVSGLADCGVVTQPAVLLQRLTSSDQKSRLVAAAVPKSFVETYGGFVCENHVIVLQPTRNDALAPELLAAMLNTRSVDRVFRSISGASNVAVFELKELLLPDPEQLAAQRTVQPNMAAAVRAAYNAPRTATAFPGRRVGK